MVRKKTHAEHSGCPVACALDIVGDHWTLVVIRDLMFSGRHEYKDILNNPEGIASNILSDRLKKLEVNGLIDSMVHPENRKRKLYYLTTKGKDLIHVLVYLARWSQKYLPDQLEISPERKKLLVKDPDRLIALTLQQLEDWERDHIKGRAKS